MRFQRSADNAILDHDWTSGKPVTLYDVGSNFNLNDFMTWLRFYSKSLGIRFRVQIRAGGLTNITIHKA